MPRILLILPFVALFGACSSEKGGADLLAERKMDVGALRNLPLPEVSHAAPVRADAPKRIVSFIPSATELIFTLGLGDRLVGRSRWCDWPREVQAVKSLGTLQAVSKEAIVDLRPDLVLLFKSQDDLARSLRRDFGIRVLTPATETSDEIFDGIATISRALGVPERGAEVISVIKRGLDSVRRAHADKPKPRVLIVLDRSSWFVPGRTSFVHELMEIAGAHNVATEVGTDQAWPSVTLETIVDWKPEVVLDLTIGAENEDSLREAAAFWSDRPYIPAVKSRRVHFLEAGVLVRPGPRMAAVAEALAGIIHE